MNTPADYYEQIKNKSNAEDLFYMTYGKTADNKVIFDGLKAANNSSNSSRNSGGNSSGGSSYSGNSGSPSNGTGIAGKINSVFAHNQFDYSTEKVNIGNIVGQIAGGLKDLFTNPLQVADKFKKVIGAIFDSYIDYYNMQNDLLETINSKTMLSGELSSKFRQDIIDVTPFTESIGISFRELSGGLAQLVENSGRFKLVNGETIRELTSTSKAYFNSLEEAADAFQNFQNISLGVSDASKAINKVGVNAVQLGLNAKETVKTLNTNLTELNSFGFRNGINGLERMVEKAQSLKMSLDPVFKVAEDLFDPQKAIELSAQLSTLGGNFGDLANPIKATYDATNNIEGIQDGIIDAAKSLATFNNESKRFEITGANLRIAKGAAEDMGISFKDFTNLGVQAAQKAQSVTDILSTGLIMTPEEREFIANLSTIKDGKMVIEIPKNLKEEFKLTGDKTSIALDQLNSTQLEVLRKERENLKTKTTDEVIRAQQSDVAQINNTLNSMLTQAKVSAGKSGDKLGFNFNELTKDLKGFVEKANVSIDKFITENTNDLKKPIAEFLKYIDAGVNALEGLVNKGKSLLDLSYTPTGGKNTSNNITESKVITHNVNLFSKDIPSDAVARQAQKNIYGQFGQKSYLGSYINVLG